MADFMLRLVILLSASALGVAIFVLTAQWIERMMGGLPEGRVRFIETRRWEDA